MQGSSLVNSMRRHYHLNVLGRTLWVPKVDCEITAVVPPCMDRDRQEGLSVWLEATSENAVPLYKHYGGFTSLEKFCWERGGSIVMADLESKPG